MPDFTAELANLVKGANRAIVAEQLNYATRKGEAGFLANLNRIQTRYVNKLDNLAAQGATVAATLAAIANLIATARGSVASRINRDKSDPSGGVLPPSSEFSPWPTTPNDIAYERTMLSDAFSREILAAQLRHQGSGAGPVAGFVADVDQLLARYNKKVDGFAARGGVAANTKSTLLSLANAAKTDAINAGAVDVPMIA